MNSGKCVLQNLDKKLNSNPFKSSRITIDEWKGSTALNRIRETMELEKKKYRISLSHERCKTKENLLLKRLDTWIDSCTIKRKSLLSEVELHKIRACKKGKQAFHMNGKWKSLEKLFKEKSGKKISIKNLFKAKQLSSEQRHKNNEFKKGKGRLIFFNWSKKKNMSVARSSKSTGDAPSTEEMNTLGHDVGLLNGTTHRFSCPSFHTSEEIRQTYCPHTVDTSRRPFFEYLQNRDHEIGHDGNGKCHSDDDDDDVDDTNDHSDSDELNDNYWDKQRCPDFSPQTQSLFYLRNADGESQRPNSFFLEFKNISIEDMS